ncbi:hypothetical protein COLO4_01338 [Corchorus olitorius]|uniref:Uncharacterized protein n=1 Tax=Corchorus olitorius TaxID=93759 RepID=A0A1R3L2L1_9ROSI|nr:hypothetical protein COLO4_01338 [Corchorus olitorius]
MAITARYQAGTAIILNAESVWVRLPAVLAYRCRRYGTAAD